METADKKLTKFVGLTMGVLVAGGLLLFCFVSAGHAPTLHGVRVGIVGPERLSVTIRQEFQVHAPGAIQFVSYRSSEVARNAVESRDLYGALVILRPQAVLTIASAASAPVAAALSGAFTAALSHAHFPLRVIDAAPLPPGDPRGVVILLILVPTAIVSVAYAVALSMLFKGVHPTRVVASVVGCAALLGMVVAAVSSALGATSGHVGSVWLGDALLALALMSATTGLVKLLGLAGAGVSAILLALIGIACSGAATAPQMLPAGWRALSPTLPPGSGATLLRNLVYFNGSAVTVPLLVLSLYVVGGVVTLVIGYIFDERRINLSRLTLVASNAN